MAREVRASVRPNSARHAGRLGPPRPVTRTRRPRSAGLACAQARDQRVEVVSRLVDPDVRSRTVGRPVGRFAAASACPVLAAGAGSAAGMTEAARTPAARPEDDRPGPPRPPAQDVGTPARDAGAKPGARARRRPAAAIVITASVVSAMIGIFFGNDGRAAE